MLANKDAEPFELVKMELMAGRGRWRLCCEFRVIVVVGRKAYEQGRRQSPAANLHFS